MRSIAALSVVAVLSLTGCRYEAPLTTEHKLPVDAAVLGLWEGIPDEGEESEPVEPMLVLKYSATEYLVKCPCKQDAYYFRGYPIGIAGRKCVQLEIAGYESGPPEESEKKRFDVIAYEVADSTLVVWTLNSDLVKDGLKTTDALARAFRDHKGDKDLFTDPGRYRRVRR